MRVIFTLSLFSAMLVFSPQSITANRGTKRDARTAEHDGADCAHGR
jgi:hypothetical protein